MQDNLLIRPETAADADAITEVTLAAFKTLAISRHTEQYIVAALRAAKALTISLVAERGGRVVGHIALSPVTISDGSRDWYGLGPISILPELHRRGIGSALMREGLALLKGLNAQGGCLVGDPNYYVRFVFKNIPGFIHEGVPPEFVLALPMGGRAPKGTV